MEKSDLINELVAALSKAQAVMSNPVKDSQNPHFKNKYASLAACIEETRKPLTDHGLIVSQLTFVADKEVYVRTLLAHSSGQYIASVYPVWPTKDDPQGFGSALSYARRYSYLAILNLKDEDDDGEKGSGRETPGRSAQTGKTQNKEEVTGRKITKEEFDDLLKVGGEKGWTYDDLLEQIQVLGITKFVDMNLTQYEHLLNNVKKFPKQKEVK